MENISTAIEIGQRCRKFRNALGLSQQALADKIGTTPQNISKYEKEGIYNIEVIQDISKALGHDLLTDEVDAEGTVGEIGKEILLLLTKWGGRADSSLILDGWELYGLIEERCLKELFKLEKIGLCVREQYTDFYDNRQDKIFITAKGAITLKHIESEQNLEDTLENVSTYEMICEDKSCYQELLDSNQLQKKIRNLKPISGFRINFIKYLRDDCRLNNYDDDLIDLEGDFLSELDTEIIPGTNAYFDILFGLIFGVSRKMYDFVVEHLKDDDLYELNDLESELYVSDSYTEADFLKQFGKYVPAVNGIKVDDDEKHINPQLSKKEIKEKEERRVDLSINIAHADALFLTDFNAEYRKICEEKGSNNPLDWFSKEEIETYIKDNILPSANEEEKQLEEQLIQIMQMEPEIVKGYFKFTSEWEENGLANLVRTLYKVPTTE
jgi:transcriptional regulator with XRE-family HTH domain